MSSVVPVGNYTVKHITSIDELIDDVGVDLVERMKDELKAEDKVVSGNAMDSIDYDKSTQVVFSDLIYVYNLEFGRRRGSFPPISNIHKWVKDKLKLEDPEAYWTAERIANHIYRKGIKETRFTKHAIMGLVSPSGMPVITHKRRVSKLSQRQKQLRTKMVADQRISRSWKRQQRIQKKQFRAAQKARRKQVANTNRRIRKIKSGFHKAKKTVNRANRAKSYLGKKKWGNI